MIAKQSVDYKVEAEQLATTCKQGCGDADACHRLFVLALRERGIIDAQETLHLATTLCAKGDKLACGLGVAVGIEPVSALGDPIATRTACLEKKDKATCEMIIAFQAIAGGGNTAAGAADVLKAACEAGVTESCEQLVRDKAADQPTIDRVTAACTSESDPDACAAIGKPIDPKALCTRHDFQACEAMGDTTGFAASASGSGGKVQRLKELAQLLPPIVKACGEKDQVACDALAKFSRPNACK